MDRFGEVSLLGLQTAEAELETTAVRWLAHGLLTGDQNLFRVGEISRPDEYSRQVLVGLLHRWRNAYRSLQEIACFAGSSDLY